MSRIVRVALTQTTNAYAIMPSRVADLHLLAPRLDDVRRANVDAHVALMAKAAAQGVRAIGFGELFTAPYFGLGRDPMWFALAEDAATGLTVTALRAAARKHAMIVVAPIYELDPNGLRYNTAVVIDEKGEILGKYRKTHIPEGENEQGAFCEPFYYGKSEGGAKRGGANVSDNPYFPVFQTSIGRIGVAICYDRHFDGVMHSLAKNGAELVFSPAVTFGAKSARMWRLEFATDAARHRLVIGGSNKRGAEAPWNQAYFGESHFVGPNGEAPNLSTDPELIVADVDLGALTGPDPSGWDLQRDLRPSIYTPR